MWPFTRKQKPVASVPGGGISAMNIYRYAARPYAGDVGIGNLALLRTFTDAPTTIHGNGNPVQMSMRVTAPQMVQTVALKTSGLGGLQTGTVVMQPLTTKKG